MNSSRFKPLSQPEFILVVLFSSPESAAYAKYYAALVSGNDLIGEVVLLKEKEIMDTSECIYSLNEPVWLGEWEWHSDSLSEEEKRMTSDLYRNYVKKNTEGNK